MEFKEICSPPGRFVLFQEKVTFPEAAQVRTWTIRTFFFTYMNIWPLGLLHVSRRNSCDRNGWGLWEVLLLNTNEMAWIFFNWHQTGKKLSSPKVGGFLKRQGKRWQLCSTSLAALHWYFSSEFEKTALPPHYLYWIGWSDSIRWQDPNKNTVKGKVNWKWYLWRKATGWTIQHSFHLLRPFHGFTSPSQQDSLVGFSIFHSNPLDHQDLECDFQAYIQLRTVLVFRTLAWGKPPMTLTVVKNTQQFVRYPNCSWKYSQDEKNLCPGHSVSILVEGTLPFFYTWHRVQAAPGFESGKF